MNGPGTVLTTGLGVFAAGLAAHALLWRVRLPRRHTRALFAIFGFLFFVTLERITPYWSPPSVLQFALLYFSLVMAYVITYSAIEASSPSLLLVNSIAEAGKEGLPEPSLRAQLSENSLILPRLDDLVRDGMVHHERGGYALTAKGRRFISLFVFYRRLLGKSLGG